MLGLKSVRFYSLKGIGMDKFNKSDLATLPLMILNANWMHSITYKWVSKLSWIEVVLTLWTWQWLLRKSQSRIDLSRLQWNVVNNFALSSISWKKNLHDDPARTTCQRGRSRPLGSWPWWRLSCRGLQSTGCTCSQSGTCTWIKQIQVLSLVLLY